MSSAFVLYFMYVNSVTFAVCRNILFYYGLGISVGVLASVLILVFVISRFIPKVSTDHCVIFLICN